MGSAHWKGLRDVPEAVTIQLDSEAFSAVPCPECQGRLSVHQPEPEAPSELLGTCPDCGAWHLVALTPDESRAVVARLRVVDQIRQGLASA